MPLAGACRKSAPDRGEELVVYDILGAGAGSLIGVSEGREAANPFGKTKTPVDAYCACLIDHLDVRSGFGVRTDRNESTNRQAKA